MLLVQEQGSPNGLGRRGRFGRHIGGCECLGAFLLELATQVANGAGRKLELTSNSGGGCTAPIMNVAKDTASKM